MRLRKTLLASAAVALGLGLASPVMAATTGSISTGDGNDGVNPIYGMDSQIGEYGQNWAYYGDQALEVDIIFLGREAGFNNSFWFQGVQLFQNGDIPNNNWATDGSNGVFTTTIAANAGVLDFYFGTPNGPAVNGSNPDNSIVNDVNFFSYYNVGATYVDLWLDDGNDVDDNHDDMAIRINWDDDRNLSPVPLPAAGWLLLGGLGGLVAMGRKKKAA